MARSGITYEEVVSAAESLLIQGENPTAEKIRIVLGNTGSFTTLSKHINKWRDERLPALVSGKLQALLPTDPINQAVQSVWETLKKEQQKEIQSFKTETQEHIEAKDQTISALREKVTALSKSEEVLKKNSQALLQDFQANEQKLQELQQSLIKANHKSDSYEQLLAQQSENHKQAIDELKASNYQTIAELKDSQALITQSLTDEIEKTREKMEDYRVSSWQTIETLKSEQQKALRELVKVNSDKEQTLSQLNDAIKQIGLEAEKLEAQKANCKKADEALTRKNEELTASQQEISRLNKLIQELTKDKLTQNNLLDAMSQKLTKLETIHEKQVEPA